MQDAYNKLARILRVAPEVLLSLENKMASLTGQDGVLEDIAQENDIIVDRTLTELGLTRTDTAETVYAALVDRMIHLDQHLYDVLGRPDLAAMTTYCGKLC